ncbi:MAG TPA: lysylphosphatidylglycerol synthase domain-containing protein [Steroidobacteraceae bacterium]|nr:lysylphosphatidylglycerol synthase domain-containing protein [Steroidobacteraceae bacterium]
MKIRIVIVAALGLALAIYFVAYVGLGAVFSAAVAVGWGGFAILGLCALALFPLLGAAWTVLLPHSSFANLKALVWARMVRDSATDVLPFSQLGGIVLGARAAIVHGVSPPLAFGSMIVDVTTELLAQIAYIAIGLLVMSAGPQSSAAAPLTRIFVVGLVLAAVAGMVFLALQRHGHGLTLNLAARMLPRAVATAAAVGDSLDSIYGSRVRVGISAALHLAGWIAGAVGTFIAFRLMGARVNFASVMAIESLICATRSAAVFVPNALGVQEAAYAMLAPLFGVGADIGLAVSLIKRARDIAVSVPILLIWQAVEGRRALGADSGEGSV